MADRRFQQPGPGGVELALVDPVAESIVGVELRRVGVGLETPVDSLLGARQAAQVLNHVLGPGRALSLERFAQRGVGLEEVVIDERRRLVVHRVQATARDYPRGDAVAGLGAADYPREPALAPLPPALFRQFGDPGELLLALGGV